jgi:hypothetical protein
MDSMIADSQKQDERDKLEKERAQAALSDMFTSQVRCLESSTR